MPTPDELAAAGLQSFPTDLRRMERGELLTHFGSHSGRVVMTRLLRNLCWQVYERIQSGQEPPINSNLRSLWYRWAKPILGRIPDDDALSTDPYDILGQVLKELVLERHLLTYADLGIIDENWENRRIGTTRPEVLVFTEKTGWINWLRQIHAEFGVSTLALGGAPSAITSTYTAAHLQAALTDPTAPVRLIGVVDYDPSGRAIAQAFVRQLAAAGLDHTELVTLIEPQHYTDTELAWFAVPLPRSQATLTARWLEATGGVDGRPMGLEAESLPPPRVTDLVRLALDGTLKPAKVPLLSR